MYLPDGNIFHIKRPHGWGNMVPYRIISYCGKSFSPDDFPPLLKPSLEEHPDGDICPDCVVEYFEETDDDTA